MHSYSGVLKNHMKVFIVPIRTIRRNERQPGVYGEHHMPSRINGQVEFPGAEEEGHGGRRAGRGENHLIFVVFFVSVVSVVRRRRGWLECSN